MRRLARRLRSIFASDNLTLRQVIFRSRVAFLVFILALAGMLQWNTTWRNDLHAKNAAQARRNAEQERKNAQITRRLQIIASGLAHQQEISDYNLRLEQFDACQRANNVIARIILVVAEQPGITKAQVEQVRSRFGLEKCPPKPDLPTATTAPQLPPAPPVAPRAVIPTTTTTVRVTRTTKPPPTTTTRKRKHGKPHQVAVCVAATVA